MKIRAPRNGQWVYMEHTDIGPCKSVPIDGSEPFKSLVTWYQYEGKTVSVSAPINATAVERMACDTAALAQDGIDMDKCEVWIDGRWEKP